MTTRCRASQCDMHPRTREWWSNVGSQTPYVLEIAQPRREKRAKDISKTFKSTEKLDRVEPSHQYMLRAKRLDRQRLTHRATGPYKLGPNVSFPPFQTTSGVVALPC